LVGAVNFYFLLSLLNFHKISPLVPRQFSQVVGEWPENQILIPNWTYFHCPGATLCKGAWKFLLETTFTRGAVSPPNVLEWCVAQLANVLSSG